MSETILSGPGPPFLQYIPPPLPPPFFPAAPPYLQGPKSTFLPATYLAVSGKSRELHSQFLSPGLLPPPPLNFTPDFFSYHRTSETSSSPDDVDDKPRPFGSLTRIVPFTDDPSDSSQMCRFTSDEPEPALPSSLQTHPPEAFPPAPPLEMPSAVPDFAEIEVVQIPSHSIIPVLGAARGIVSEICQENCERCHFPIVAGHFSVNGRSFHPDCLVCGVCQAALLPPHCFCYHDAFLCRGCAAGTHEHVCFVCNSAILVNEAAVQTPGGQRVHRRCFVCAKCEAFSELVFLPDVGFFCQRCLESAPICNGCRKPIVGRYVSPNGHRYHPRCFVCCQCDKVLMGNNYVVHHNKFYCPLDGAGFHQVCAYCKGTLAVGDRSHVKWGQKFFHTRCFVCRVCGTRCDPENCRRIHGRPHCDDCYAQRLIEIPAGHRHHPAASADRAARFGEILGKEITLPVVLEEVRAGDRPSDAEVHERRRGHKHRHHHK